MPNLSKKIGLFLKLDTLYSYVFHRFLVKLRTIFQFPPLYPWEENYELDANTRKILEQIQKNVPESQRGDNPAFNKNWKSIIEREAIASHVVAQINRATGNASIGTDPSYLQTLDTFGNVRLTDKKMSPTRVDDILDYLSEQKVYPSHVAHFALEKPRTKAEVKRKEPFGSYDLATILQAPGVSQILADPAITGLIGGYFGCLPTVSSVNLFWSFTSEEGKPRGPQHFHRDVDDVKTCTMFINLTDTNEDEGAHCYVEKSHTCARLKEIFDDRKNDTLPADLNPLNRRLVPEDFFQLPLNGYGFEKLYTHFFGNQMKYLYGQRGTVLVTDNYGIHRGIPVRRHDRLILWVSYALTATHTQSARVKLQKRAAYSQIKGQIENTEINRYVLRNIVNFDG